jgi:pimeloyl-ACP methyl ester carboxylesterase
MRHIQGPAGGLAVEEHGLGPGRTIVLVHGMGGEAPFWHGVVRSLAHGHRVLVPELRGHGRSDVPADHDYSIEAHADDLEAICDALDLRGIVLVGHSFGASVAIELAGRGPDLVAGLVILDGAGDFSGVPEQALRDFLAGLDHDDWYAPTLDQAIDVALEGASNDTERRVRAAMLAAPPPMVRAMYHSLLSYHPLPALDRYTGALLLVTAPMNASDFALHALRPNYPRHAMDGVSHWLQMDAPTETARIITEFTAGLP